MDKNTIELVKAKLKANNSDGTEGVATIPIPVPAKQPNPQEERIKLQQKLKDDYHKHIRKKLLPSLN